MSKEASDRYRAANPEKLLWRTAKKRAARRGVPFTITPDDIVIPDTCPLLGIPIIYTVGAGQSPNLPSLDQIDPGKGYTPGNVMVVSYRANRLKCDATPDELITIATNMRKFL